MFNDDLLAATSISKTIKTRPRKCSKIGYCLGKSSEIPRDVRCAAKGYFGHKGKIKPQPEEEEVKKVKGKGRAYDDFYRVSIPIFLHYF